MKEELIELKSQIKLTEQQAIKRDELERFFYYRDKVVYLDADSLVFHAVYKCVTFRDLKDAYELGADRASIVEFVIQTAIERFEEQVLKMCVAIEEDINVHRVIYFFTTCRNNWRKEISTEYKAHRKKTNTTKWVNIVKMALIDQLEKGGQIVWKDDVYEADDLIAEQVRTSPRKDRIIVASMDKDLKQLPCAHFDYYQRKIEVDGEEYKVYKGFSYTTEQEGLDMFLKMLLIGDSADNIKGVKGYGPKKTDKLFEGLNTFGKLREIYKLYNNKERLKTNIKLMRL